MGISILGGCSSSPYAVLDSNPNPDNYIITGIRRSGDYAVIEAFYPDAKNYEGRKIMVYNVKGMTLPGDIPKRLDPHFCETGFAPIARFKPTADGFEMAVNFMLMMSRIDK